VQLNLIAPFRAGGKTNAEATVVIKLNQGTMKGTGCFVPFLNFLWLLSLFQDKERDNPSL
jgi:hypothetical protein